MTTNDIARHKYALIPGRYVGFNKEKYISEKRISHIFEQLNKVQGRLEEVINAGNNTKEIIQGMING